MELSKDLTQEIFISMLSSITSYKEERGSFKTWLYRIASNKLIDFYRSKFYKYKTIVDEIDDFKIYSDENIENDFLIKEDVKEIMEIVATMEPSIQEIFRLKVFAQMSFNEIASLTDVAQSTVKTRYYSTIRKIKNILKEDEDEQGR